MNKKVYDTEQKMAELRDTRVRRCMNPFSGVELTAAAKLQRVNECKSE